MIASSSWSHAFLVEKHHYLWPDVDADRARYEELRDGRMGQWCGLRTTDIEADGQQELLNWICLAGAMDLFRPRFLGHRVEAYAALASG